MTTAIKINQNDGRKQTIATGGETQIDFDFPIFEAEHLRVVETDLNSIETELTLNVDYTIPAGSIVNQAGGVIDLDPTAYPAGAIAGHAYTLLQNVPEERITDFQQAGDFFAEVLNQELDLIVQTQQQLKRDQDRSIRISDSDNLPGSLIIPLDRASKFLAFDAFGALIASEVGATSSNIADSAITTPKLNNLAVTNEKLGNDAVTSDKILNATITGADIAGTTITNANIANQTISFNKLADATPGNMIGFGVGNTAQLIAPGAADTILASTGAALPAFLSPEAIGITELLIAEVTASNDATIEFTDDVDISRFKGFRVQLDNVLPVTDDVDLRCNISTDNGSTWIVVNYEGKAYTERPATSDLSDGGITTYIGFNATTGAAGTHIGNTVGYSGVLIARDMSTTNRTFFKTDGGFTTSGGLNVGARSTHVYDVAAILNAFQFSYDSGNIASGTFKLYGLF
jgi:hypothetical protein